MKKKTRSKRLGGHDPRDYAISAAEMVEIKAAMKKSIAEFEAGKGIPVREACERLRKKYKIPRT